MKTGSNPYEGTDEVQLDMNDPIPPPIQRKWSKRLLPRKSSISKNLAVQRQRRRTGIPCPIPKDSGGLEIDSSESTTASKQQHNSKRLRIQDEDSDADEQSSLTTVAMELKYGKESHHLAITSTSVESDVKLSSAEPLHSNVAKHVSFVEPLNSLSSMPPFNKLLQVAAIKNTGRASSRIRLSIHEMMHHRNRRFGDSITNHLFLEEYKPDKSRLYIKWPLHRNTPINGECGWTQACISKWDILEHIIDSQHWKCKNVKMGPKVARDKEGLVTFSNDKTGKSLARMVVMLHSWLCPPSLATTQSWQPAEVQDAICTTKCSSSEGCILGFTDHNNVILVHYSNGKARHFLIHNSSNNKPSIWNVIGCFGERQDNVDGTSRTL